MIVQDDAASARRRARVRTHCLHTGEASAPEMRRRHATRTVTTRAMAIIRSGQTMGPARAARRMASSTGRGRAARRIRARRPACRSRIKRSARTARWGPAHRRAGTSGWSGEIARRAPTNAARARGRGRGRRKTAARQLKPSPRAVCAPFKMPQQRRAGAIGEIGEIAR